MKLALVGDSDIAQWPPELLPTLHGDEPPIVSGHGGATLREIIPFIENVVKEQHDLLVACAGENDVGSGYTLDETLVSFRNLMDKFFKDCENNNGTDASSTTPSRFLVFLGPKLEPWLADDSVSRKQYIKMSRSMKRACEKHEFSHSIIFVDCLTMFCGESANVKGAVHGGQAKADDQYFSKDGLHLNQEGYKLWNKVVSEHITSICERIQKGNDK